MRGSEGRGEGREGRAVSTGRGREGKGRKEVRARERTR